MRVDVSKQKPIYPFQGREKSKKEWRRIEKEKRLKGKRRGIGKGQGKDAERNTPSFPLTFSSFFFLKQHMRQKAPKIIDSRKLVIWQSWKPYISKRVFS